MPYLNLDTAEMYYDVSGAGVPLVMSHAGIAHSAMWDPQFDYFAREYRVVRYDQRGFGKTVTRTNDYNPRADLLALLDHLAIDRAVLMGCSMGGSLSLDFALDYSSRVAALILIDAGISGYTAPDAIKAQWQEQDKAFAAGDFERVIDLEIEMWVDGPKRAPGSADAAVRQKVREMERENIKRNADDLNPVRLAPPALGRLHEVRVPALILVGDSDQPHTLESARILADSIPNAQLVEIKNAAHLPSMEHPEHVNGVIAQFLKKI